MREHCTQHGADGYEQMDLLGCDEGGWGGGAGDDNMKR